MNKMESNKQKTKWKKSYRVSPYICLFYLIFLYFEAAILNY